MTQSAGYSLTPWLTITNYWSLGLNRIKIMTQYQKIKQLKRTRSWPVLKHKYLGIVRVTFNPTILRMESYLYVEGVPYSPIDFSSLRSNADIVEARLKGFG